MPTRPSTPFARPRWTREDAREALSALDRSGKPVSVFAAEHGIDPQRLYQWRRRLGAAERTTFHEIVIRPPPRNAESGASGEPFEIALTGGHVVRVPASFDAAALLRLLDVLAQARSC